MIVNKTIVLFIYFTTLCNIYSNYDNYNILCDNLSFHFHRVSTIVHKTALLLSISPTEICMPCETQNLLSCQILIVLRLIDQRNIRFTVPSNAFRFSLSHDKTRRSYVDVNVALHLGLNGSETKIIWD